MDTRPLTMRWTNAPGLPSLILFSLDPSTLYETIVVFISALLICVSVAAGAGLRRGSSA